MAAVRKIRFQLDVLTLEGDVKSSIDNRIVEGQVNVDVDAEGPTRSMTVSLYDPNRNLRLDSDDPRDGSLFADRMLRAWYGVWVEGVGWVDVPIFTGPIIKVSRDDAIMNVECQGKEVFALEPVWHVFTVEPGVKKTDAIRRVMRERAGETAFDIPDLDAKLAHACSLTPQPPQPHKVGKGKKAHMVRFQGINSNTPWGLSRAVAHSMSRQLYYDGHGRLRLRRLPGSALFTFDEALIESPPQTEFDLTDMKNAVRVTGKTLHEGKEKKAQVPTHVVSGQAVAPEGHPLSPHRLGRRLGDGTVVPRYIPEFVTNDAIRSDVEATHRAEQILADVLAEQVTITFDALPVPDVEEMDLIRVRYDDLAFSARLRKFTLPLTHDGVMTVGYLSRVKKPKRPGRPNNG